MPKKVKITLTKNRKNNKHLSLSPNKLINYSIYERQGKSRKPEAKRKNEENNNGEITW